MTRKASYALGFSCATAEAAGNKRASSNFRIRKESYASAGCPPRFWLPHLTARFMHSAFIGLMKKKKKVEFSSHTGNLAPMRKFVRKFLDAYPFSERERLLVVLGVDEA